MGDGAQSQPELVWDRISYLLRLPSNLKPLSPEYNSAVQQWMAENLGIPVDHGLFRLDLLSPRGLLRTIESAFVLEDSQRANSYAGNNPILDAVAARIRDDEEERRLARGQAMSTQFIQATDRGTSVEEALAIAGSAAALADGSQTEMNQARAASTTTSHLQILEEAMHQGGLNPPQLAQKIRALLKPGMGNRLKADRTTVYRIIHGETKKPQPEIREALIKVLGLKAEKASIVRRGLGGTGAAQSFSEKL